MDQVELKVAEALLDTGVSVPFRAIRLPFSKRVVQLRATMRRPKLGSRIRISRHYLKLGVTADQVDAFTIDEQMEFLAKHGRRLSKMIALTICRGFISGKLFTSIVAFIIREFVPDEFILGAQREFIDLLGTQSFTTIIRSGQKVNLMAPRLSHENKGS